MAEPGMSRRIAYLFPLFPVINQTFTLAEVVWLKERGYDIRLYSLLSRIDPKLQQAEAKSLIAETHYCPSYTSRELWAPILKALRQSPARVLELYRTVWRSWRATVPLKDRAS